MSSNLTASSMSTFELKNGQIVCKKCGSKNVSIKAGMMVDRAICHECGNEDYIWGWGTYSICTVIGGGFLIV